ncbi:hypothetical protein AB595_13365 [Massilia sp. WF1]|nr:hypothetical protein [Massilia sp. WF1]KLU36232.1 hypothetical protein AB595_13365 [Massilia sp. WF1]
MPGILYLVVGDDEVRPVGAEGLQGLFAVIGHRHAVALDSQVALENVPYRFFIVDYQDVFQRYLGRCDISKAEM